MKRPVIISSEEEEVLTLTSLLSRRLSPRHPVHLVMTCATLAAAAAIAGGLWYRRKTTPFPYSQRWMLDKELPFLTRERLCQVLAPQAGERILEIGPGTGLFSVPVAQRLSPGGTLDVFDVQQVMLDHTLRVGA